MARTSQGFGEQGNIVVATSRARRFIIDKAAASSGIAPLPATTYKLMPHETEDKVLIVAKAGDSRTRITIKVPKGTCSCWIEKLTVMNRTTALAELPALIADAAIEDLWFADQGRRVHLHWMGHPPKGQSLIESFKDRLHDLEREHRHDG